MRFYTDADHHLYVMEFPNGKRYFGISVDPQTRWRKHRSKAKTGSTLPVHCAIRRFGFEAVLCRIVATGSRAYIADLEVRAIAAYGSQCGSDGYNVTIGGEISPMLTPAVREKLRGRKFSDEHLKNMKDAAAKRGVLPETLRAAHKANRGRPLSEEHRAALSAVRKGRKRTPEQIAKAAEANRGKTRSVEARERIGAAFRGKPWSDARRAAHERRVAMKEAAA